MNPALREQKGFPTVQTNTTTPRRMACRDIAVYRAPRVRSGYSIRMTRPKSLYRH